MTPRQHLIAPTQTLQRPLIPVIGYVRVSTWREEKISNQIQRDVITDAAARRGRYVAEWIEDLDESGRHFKRKVMRAIESVEQRTYPEIWVWKFSRFGRSRYGVAINLARIENVGGQLVSATEDVDATTAVGRFTRGMLLEVAAFESDRAGEQWKETHELRRSLGLPSAGRKRFGYQWYPRRVYLPDGGWTLQEERYEVLPNQAEVSIEGLQRYNAGLTGYAKIAHWWNDLGFLTTRGTPWQDQTVKGYFDSGFAAGLLKIHDRECRDISGCRNPEHYEYLPAEHEAIATGDEWDAYRERRDRRRSTPSRSLEPVYPLSGLMRCAVCGSHATVQCGKQPGYAYRCGRRVRGGIRHEAVWVRRVVVELRVFDWLLGVRAQIDAIVSGKMIVPAPTVDVSVEVLRKRLTADLAKIVAAIDRATESHAMGDIPRDSYLRTRDKLLKRQAEAQTRLGELPEADGEADVRGPQQFQEVVVGLLEEWDTLAVNVKREALSRLIDRVEIGPGGTVGVVPSWPSRVLVPAG